MKSLLIFSIAIFSFSSFAATVSMTESGMRILTKYDISYIIEKAYNEPVSNIEVKGFADKDVILNVFFQSGPTGCYRVAVGESVINNETRLTAKSLDRDLSCDKN